MKEHREEMGSEQKMERRKEMRERFEKMSPEEREKFKREMGKRGDMPHAGDRSNNDKK
jgi:hypothetical protein